MIRLNLLPDVKIEYLHTKRMQAKVVSVATIVTIAVAGLVVLLALWVFGGQAIQKSVLSDQIKKSAAELKAKPDIEKYLTIQNQLNSLTTLHDGKSDFSRLLTFLPTLNPAPPHNVTLTSVELASAEDTGNTLVLQGEVKDYTGLTTFRDTLANAQLAYKLNDVETKEPLFETVSVASSSLEKSTTGGSVVTFKIETVYNPNAFLMSAKNVAVTVPVKTTTQSAQSSPNVFGESSVRGGQ